MAVNVYEGRTYEEEQWEEAWLEEKEKAKPMEVGHKVWCVSGSPMTHSPAVKPVLIRSMADKTAEVEYADGSTKKVKLSDLYKVKPF